MQYSQCLLFLAFLPTEKSATANPSYTRLHDDFHSLLNELHGAYNLFVGHHVGPTLLQTTGKFNVPSRVVSVSCRQSLAAGCWCGTGVWTSGLRPEHKYEWKSDLAAMDVPERCLQSDRASRGGTSWEKSLPCYGSSG